MTTRLQPPPPEMNPFDNKTRGQEKKMKVPKPLKGKYFLFIFEFERD